MAEFSRKRICLVTPGHLSTNPRIVKEADALAKAGFDVSVVASRFIAWADEADIDFKASQWKVKTVAFGSIAGRRKHFCQSVRRRVCLGLYKTFGVFGELAYHPVIPELMRAACKIEADLYIAHNLAALPAAYRAARKHGALLGFDAEDFHSGQFVESPENSLALRLTREIEGRYLPCCDYISAASPGIARAYAEKYGIEMPVVLLNVFPKAWAPGYPVSDRRTLPMSLYWFSQTIGPDRGLETAIEAISLSRSRPILFLRGKASDGYENYLLALAERFNVSDRLRFLPTAAPAKMIALAAEHGIGLASEEAQNQNRNICLTNKLFVYLLAGIPILATSTSAQEALASELSGAMFLYSQCDPSSLAEIIDSLLLKTSNLVNARQVAWAQGQQRFHWEFEERTFLRAVDDLLSQRS